MQLSILSKLVSASSGVGYHGMPLELCNLIAEYVPSVSVGYNVHHFWQGCDVTVKLTTAAYGEPILYKTIVLTWEDQEIAKSTIYIHSYEVGSIVGYNEWLLNIDTSQQVTQFKINRIKDCFVCEPIRRITFRSEIPRPKLSLHESGFLIDACDLYCRKGFATTHMWVPPYTEGSPYQFPRLGIMIPGMLEWPMDVHYDSATRTTSYKERPFHYRWTLFVDEKELKSELPIVIGRVNAIIIDHGDAFVLAIIRDKDIDITIWHRSNGALHESDHFRINVEINGVSALTYHGSCIHIRGLFSIIDPRVGTPQPCTTLLIAL